MDESVPPPPPVHDRLSDLPGGRRLWLVFLPLLVALVVVDGLWLNGRLFGAILWYRLKWMVAAAGLGFGAFAYLRRAR